MPDINVNVDPNPPVPVPVPPVPVPTPAPGLTTEQVLEVAKSLVKVLTLVGTLTGKQGLVDAAKTAETIISQSWFPQVLQLVLAMLHIGASKQDIEKTILDILVAHKAA